jgi:chromosome segregation ATPase
MTVEAISALIAALGVIVATLYGVHKASSGAGKAAAPEGKTSLPDMVTRYLDMLSNIDKNLGGAVDLLRRNDSSQEHAVEVLKGIRRSLEGTNLRQETMVDELEKIERTMARIEQGQGAAAHHVAAMKNHEEVAAGILAQIREETKGHREETRSVREEIKNLSRDEYKRHRST